MHWDILETGPAQAQENMDRDQELLLQLTPNSKPILHFYEWASPSITHGYFVKPEHFLNLSILQDQGIQLARRPTGGGITFHFCDVAFSAIIPASHSGYSVNTLDNYAFVNQKVLNVLKKLFPLPSLSLHQEQLPSHPNQNFCMASCTKYDVILNGQKVGGAAQRKTKEGFLHQGSIFLGIPTQEQLAPLLKDPTLLKAMYQESRALLDCDCQEAKQSLRSSLIQEFSLIGHSENKWV